MADAIVLRKDIIIPEPTTPLQGAAMSEKAQKENRRWYKAETGSRRAT
jgi:hypothetical protein